MAAERQTDDLAGRGEATSDQVGVVLAETEAIACIERLMCALDQRSVETSTIRQFFDVGEWLLAFEGIEAHIPHFTAAERREVSALKDYFFNSA